MCEEKECMQKARVSGFVAVEGVIVIMLLLLAAGGATFWYQHGRGQYEAGEATSQINLINSNISRVFAGSDYADLDNALAIATDIVTGDMIQGAAITNPWGGAVTLGPTAGDTQYTIAYAGVPEAACIELSQIDDDWVSVDVDGTAVTVGDKGTSVAACDATNTITWTSN